MDRGFLSTDFLDLIKAIDFASKTFCVRERLRPFNKLGRSVSKNDKSDSNLYVKEKMNFHIDQSTFLE